MLKSIKNISFYNTRTMVRCDFNVPVEQGRILDDLKIKRALDTIKHLRETGAKIILISHLGRPAPAQSSKSAVPKQARYGADAAQSCSLAPVKHRLAKLLGSEIEFSRKVIGRQVQSSVKKMKLGEILLLENLRLERGEEENTGEFAESLAELADCYVGEAFGVCHRRHASVVSLPKLLPHFVGFNMEKEIEVLSGLSERPKRPLVVVIGGAKVESKIRVVERFLKLADHVLLGGRVADTILAVKGICVGKPWPENEEVIEIIKNMDITNPKLHLPVDVLASPSMNGDVYVRKAGPGSVRSDEGAFDVGPETVKTFSEIIKKAAAVFWSGPMGVFESKTFAQGTKGMVEAIVRSPGIFTVAGGGDTIRALQEFGSLDNFSFISTGGGAMLQFLSGEELPGIKALE